VPTEKVQAIATPSKANPSKGERPGRLAQTPYAQNTNDQVFEFLLIKNQAAGPQSNVSNLPMAGHRGFLFIEKSV